jgi:hypothetical protein
MQRSTQLALVIVLFVVVSFGLLQRLGDAYHQRVVDDLRAELLRCSRALREKVAPMSELGMCEEVRDRQSALLVDASMWLQRWDNQKHAPRLAASITLPPSVLETVDLSKTVHFTSYHFTWGDAIASWAIKLHTVDPKAQLLVFVETNSAANRVRDVAPYALPVIAGNKSVASLYTFNGYV